MIDTDLYDMLSELLDYYSSSNIKLAIYDSDKYHLLCRIGGEGWKFLVRLEAADVTRKSDGDADRYLEGFLYWRIIDQEYIKTYRTLLEL